jgi:glucose/arabinose dehydrogenase/mono/diheme cytochrome c family protein
MPFALSRVLISPYSSSMPPLPAQSAVSLQGLPIAFAFMLSGATALYAIPAGAADDSQAGATIFKSRCAVCHTTGSGGAQGPGLAGVVGRKAASAAFGYSKALRGSGLIWDAALLDRYLAAPGKLVPGTRMVLAVPSAADRRKLIAYLATLRPKAEARAEPPAAPAPAQPAATPGSEAAPGLRTGKAALGDFRSDAPGVRRRLSLVDLPPPFQTSSARNSPRVSDQPPGAKLSAPPGFTVELFARDLENPRLLRVAPNGDIFVAESAAGRIRLLRASDGASKADLQSVYASGLDQPFGIAFHPPGPDPRWVYVAENNRVLRFEYRSGDLKARATPQVMVPRLSKSHGGHWTRDIAFSKDGARMFVSVGSASNVADGMKKKSADELRAWEAAHGVGATWDDEEDRADVLVFDPQGKGGKVFATGLRNCVGLAVQPATGELWCSTNERDGLGDDLVPDYITRVKEGAFYGWPWWYLGDHEDPRRQGERPDLAGKVTVPDVIVQPHSASLQMTFYGGAMFPAEYAGSAFAAFHGSWNRSRRTGYKVVRVLVDKAGIPTGEYEDFVTGFVIDDGHVWGRPVGVAVARDGALLISEDGNGTLWRVAVARP